MRIQDYLVVSDLDGTLVPASQQISNENLQAIERFRSLGGLFTVATGRSAKSAERFLQAISLDTPAITNNGALIYDPKSNAPLWYQTLPPVFRQIVSEIHREFPQLAIEAITAGDGYFVLDEAGRLESLATVAGGDAQQMDIANLPDDCCKVIFLIDDSQFEAISQEIIGRKYAGVSFLKATGGCLEMMAESIDKGYPLEKLAQLCGRPFSGVVAVGDYYNDIAMLKKAPLGVTLENAPEDIRQEADLVVPSCEDNGIAFLLNRLIDWAEAKHS